MKILVASLLLLAVGACSSEGSADVADPGAGPGSSAAPTPPGAQAPGSAEPSSCAEVRAGIDAFNRGELDETVSRFEDALPLARAAAEEDPSRLADDLLEAVEYYAELPAEDYPAAVQTPAFEKYKQITLSQCAGEGQMTPPDEPELEV